ncbi:MAG: APC family permease [Acidobacteria bacterium]|nr:APC family permease [Acidobacteriota bacterium]
MTRFRRSSAITLPALAAATFFMASGGPYGLEDILQKSGYSATLLILILTPIAWSLPVALLVGELGAAIPEEGGYFAWVNRGLGPFWGFQEAWLSLAASIFDMAIYPTLFVLYLARLWPAATAGHTGILLGALMIAGCAVWNIAGARAVGDGSILLAVVLLGPFAALAALAVFRHPAASQNTTASRPVDLLGGSMVAMWNYMGWDNASTVAGEVARPQRNYPRGILGALALTVACYVLPVAGLARYGMNVGEWSTGSWVDAGKLLGGEALAVAVVLGGMVCGLGMFNALVLSYSRVPLAMAEAGYLPRALARCTRRSDAPWVSIMVCSAAWTACLALNFERLVLLDVLLYGTALILEFVALAVLRWREPGLARPFRVPGGKPVAVLMGAGPLAMLALAFDRGRREAAAGLNPIVIAAGLAAAGVVIYFASAANRERSQM